MVLSPFIPVLLILVGQTKTLHILLNSIQPCLLPVELLSPSLCHLNSVSFTQCSTRPSHLRLSLLLIINNLTGSNPNNSQHLSSLPSIINLQIHPIMLMSLLSVFTSCTTFIVQVSLPHIIQLFTQDVHASPFPQSHPTIHEGFTGN